MIGSTHSSLTREDILKYVSEADIAAHYFGVTSLPTLINSPLRKDDNPSFALYSPDGKDVNYQDYATGDKGGLMSLLMQYFSLPRDKVYEKIYKEVIMSGGKSTVKMKKNGAKTKQVTMNALKDIKVKVREWQDYDIEYWRSYGIDLSWLKWAGVKPVSHKFLIYQDGRQYVFGAEKYAYCFPEKKEGKVTLKIYQPFSKERKWHNCHDKSVLGLWSKLPKRGRSVCICSSVKDALCLWSNMNIPCICVQGERFPVSQTAMGELRRRFKDIYVCYDNDKAGIEDAAILCDRYAIINIEIPQFEGGKDISDYFKKFGKTKFKALFKRLIIESRDAFENELPF